MSGGGRRTVRWLNGIDDSLSAEHGQSTACDAGGCGYIVEEHQRWGKPEEAAVPEFTIEVAYKTKDHAGKAVSPGWRYILKWRENGEQKQYRQYGWEDKDAAVRAAQRKAREIALTLAPVHVETFTPEI